MLLQHALPATSSYPAPHVVLAWQALTEYNIRWAMPLKASLMRVMPALEEVLEAALEFAQVQEATVGAVGMEAAEVNRAGLRQPALLLTCAFRPILKGAKQRMEEEKEASGD